MFKNLILKIHLVFFVLSALAGFLSLILLREIWGIGDVDLSDAWRIFFLYIFSILIFFLIFNKINFSSISYRQKFSPLQRFLLVSLYFLSCAVYLFNNINVSYLYSGSGTSGSTLLTAILIIVPYISAIEKKWYSDILYFISAISFAIALVRFNIAVLMILYLFSYHGSLLKLFRRGFILLFLLAAISIIRESSSVSDSGPIPEYTILMAASSSLGAEWRDGILGNENLDANKIELAEKDFFKTIFITTIPMWSRLPSINSNELYKNQLVYYYAEQIGLIDKGYSGIRVGLIWEFYYFYSYFGVILIALMNSILIRLSKYHDPEDKLSFIPIILGVASVYSVIGQPNMYLSIFFQYSFYYLIIISLLSLLSYKKQ